MMHDSNLDVNDAEPVHPGTRPPWSPQTKKPKQINRLGFLLGGEGVCLHHDPTSPIQPFN